MNFARRYPRLWVTPDGRVFGMQDRKMYFMGLNGIGSLQDAGTLPAVSCGNTSTALMYQPGKTLQVSGYGNNAVANGGRVWKKCFIWIGGVNTVMDWFRPQQLAHRSNPLALFYGKVYSVEG